MQRQRGKLTHARSASIPYWPLYLTEGVVKTVLPLPILGGKIPLRNYKGNAFGLDATVHGAQSGNPCGRVSESLVNRSRLSEVPTKSPCHDRAALGTSVIRRLR